MSEFERFACEVAREAGEALAHRFGNGAPVDVGTKGLHDFVTEADREAESLIVARIRERFPDHSIMAEEGSPEAEGRDHRWIVDPLDGTTNFIHGVPVFAVAIALEDPRGLLAVAIALEDPRGLLAAAIYDPLREEMFHATRDAGARLNGRRIGCSAVDEMGAALLATGFPFRRLDRLDRYLETFAVFTRAAAGIRRAGSAALDLAYTACGRYDGFWEIGLNTWDVAAGALLVREAGGVVTDVAGGGAYLAGDVLAAGSAVHTLMLEVTRRSLA